MGLIILNSSMVGAKDVTELSVEIHDSSLIVDEIVLLKSKYSGQKIKISYHFNRHPSFLHGGWSWKQWAKKNEKDLWVWNVEMFNIGLKYNKK